MNRLTSSRHYIQTAPGTERNRKPSNGDVVNAVDVVIWTEPDGICPRGRVREFSHHYANVQHFNSPPCANSRNTHRLASDIIM